MFGHQIHAVAIVTAKPPFVLTCQPHGFYRARDIAISILGGGDHIDLARNAGRQLARGQPLRVSKGAATCAHPRGAHLAVIGVEAADQAPPRGQYFARVDIDMHGLTVDWLAIQIERGQPQPQIAALHQPAIGPQAQLHAGGKKRDAVRGGERLAVGVLIVHLDLHVGGVIDLTAQINAGFAGAIPAQRERQRGREGQIGRGVVAAIIVQRNGAFHRGFSAEGPAIPTLWCCVAEGVTGADGDRHMAGPAARKIADEQIQRYRFGADQRLFRPADSGAHCGDSEFIDADALAGGDFLIADLETQRVIALWGALGGCPVALADAVGTDHHILFEMGVRAFVGQHHLARKSLGQAETMQRGAAQNMFHIHRFADPDQAAVEDGVKDVALREIVIGHFEIIRRNALTPRGHGKAEIAILARRNHQRMLGAVRLAGAAAGRIWQAGHHQSSLRVRGALRQLFAGAAVGHANVGARHHRRLVEAGDPSERALPPPFEMHRHIGDQRAGCDIARRIAAQQRPAQLWAGEFDDVKTGVLQRHADDLELFALAGQASVSLVPDPPRAPPSKGVSPV